MSKILKPDFPDNDESFWSEKKTTFFTGALLWAWTRKNIADITFKAVFYKHFSNELAPILLDVYDPWEKLRTRSVTSKTGIISAIYKKGDKRYIEN